MTRAGIDIDAPARDKEQGADTDVSEDPMADSQQPNETAAWGALAAHYEQIKDLHLRRLFAEDPGRANA